REITRGAGFFLLGPPSAPDFSWRDLARRRVLVFAEAPTPRLCLEYLLERHGVPLSAVELVPDLPAEHAVSHFLSGRADYLLQGQPITERLLASGQAQLAAALGPALGHLAFSAYLVPPRVLTERADTLEAVLRALYRAQLWLHRQPAEAIVERVAPALPDDPPALLQSAIRRYLAGKTWAPDPV